jgi:hypothetical protein
MYIMYVTYVVEAPMAASPKRVLTVNQVRDNIKAIREAALHERAEVHFGERGRDEVVILSARELAALKARAKPPITANPAPRGRRRTKHLAFVEAILAGGTFNGPGDLAENVDDYLYFGRALPDAPER